MKGPLLLLLVIFFTITTFVWGERVYVPVEPKGNIWIGAGRYEWSTGQGGVPVVLADWPCVTFNVSITAATGTTIVGVGVVMEGGHNDFLVFYNDQQVAAGSAGGNKLLTDDQLREYQLPEPKGNATHSLNVSLVKVTEASYFALQGLLPLSRLRLYGFAVYTKNVAAEGTARAQHTSALQVSPPATARRRIEFFSDSDSNGFGIEGADSWTCLWGLESYENCWEGYAATVSRWLGADYHIEAWSGKGVVKNALGLFDTSDDPMPLYWPRAIATDSASSWNFTLWVPDLVVLLLGTNDYYAWPYPSDEQFINGYVHMVETILSSYRSTTASGAPLTMIALCGGTTDNDRAPCPRVQQAVKQLLLRQTRARIFFVEIPTALLAYPADYGCLDHRNIVGQRKLASFLLGQVRSLMGW